MELKAGELIGAKYRLERPLARGGMGEVWIARHIELDVDVAVKFIQAAANHSKAGARFRTEARAAAQLKSPHVVRVYDYGLHEGAPYLAMELLEGQDLQSRIDRLGKLGPEEALCIVEQAAKALGVAHSAGIVHRDIKPSNLFLALEGGDEVLKVLDFGIAKQEQPDGATTSQGVLLGSPAYMSPEQARGHAVDARSDLWSMGVVVFEMLSGDSPFSGTTVGDSIAKICWEPVPMIQERAPELPERFQAFFDRALARDKTQRFQDAEELLNAFRAVVNPNAELGGNSSLRTSLVSQPSATNDWGRTEPTVELSPSSVIDRSEGASLAASSHVIAPQARPRWVLPIGLLALGAIGIGLAYFSSRPTARPEPAAPSAPLQARIESSALPEADGSRPGMNPALTPSSSGAPSAAPAPSGSAEASATAPSAAPAAIPKVRRPAVDAPPVKSPKPNAPAEKKPPVRDDTFGI
ncbi:MAG: protein kinase [Polyangiaceae bacterium]